MKKLICGILIILTYTHVFGQARLGAYPWTIALTVVDGDGKPVQDARTWVSYDGPKEGQPTDPFQPNDWALAGYSDKNGAFAASHTDHASNLGIQVQKNGYYPTLVSYELYMPGQFDDKKVAANRNFKLSLILKKIVKPIPMYAKQVDGGPPIFNESIGYDLMVGDWVAPHGKGQTTDIIFIGNLNQKTKDDFDYELTVSFPKKGDGIQEFIAPIYYLHSRGSVLRSAEVSPKDGYQPQVVRKSSRHPGMPTKADINNPDRNYYFRVRTELDENGNVKSALYGKIYGDFMQFDYYLNPTPNDNDVEFDPKHNLLKGLKTFERVKQP